MIHKNKKAQIDQLQGLIVALVVVGIILVVGFLIFAQTKEQVVSLITSETTGNETFSYTNATLGALTNSPTAVELSCIIVYNDTDNLIEITATNYTCGVSGLMVNDTQTDSIFSSTLYVNYTYKAADYAYNASSTVQNATQDIPSWLAIFIVVIIGALLIGLVSFLRQQSR